MNLIKAPGTPGAYADKYPKMRLPCRNSAHAKNPNKMPDLFHTGRAREDSGTYSLGSWQAVGVESTRGGELYEMLYCNDRASFHSPLKIISISFKQALK